MDPVGVTDLGGIVLLPTPEVLILRLLPLLLGGEPSSVMAWYLPLPFMLFLEEEFDDVDRMLGDILFWAARDFFLARSRLWGVSKDDIICWI